MDQADRVRRLKESARAIWEAALRAADPYAATAAAVRELPLTGSGRLFLAAVGKASVRMAAAARKVLAERGKHPAASLLVTPHDYPVDSLPPASDLVVRSAGHPVPDQASSDAAAALLALMAGITPQDTCLFLVSGGGSSLLSFPHSPLSIEDLAETSRLLLASGAGITAFNTVRRHVSGIAGGRLAAGCQGSIVTLAVSDVVGDDLATIASGPTVPDPSTFADALAVLQEFGLLERVPRTVRAFLEEGAAGRVEETPKQLPPRHRSTVIASGRTALHAAEGEARARGFEARILSAGLTGEAREAGRALAREALLAQQARRLLPVCLLTAGETTVTVRGKGRGGRNQEVALAAALVLDGTRGVVVTSLATDGIDGSTSDAGAYASGLTIARGKDAGYHPEVCLDNNDSHAFLEAAGEVIHTGPTGTNVNDLAFALVEAEG